MRGAVLVAVAAAIGNMLQGWDNAAIAGAVIYIKREFHLEAQPAIEGLVVATSLIGATVITTFSGPVSDSVGRRPMLIASSALYFLAGLLMLWSPNVGVLLLSRLVDGFAVGLAVTLVPVYISETAPPEIRGRLNTLPQFTGSGGMFLSYCMVFAMTLAASRPDWRLMLGVLSLLSLLYLLLTVCYLPESPRWLVSKGRTKEARAVLQMLRGRHDVAGEMALLAEGLGSTGIDDTTAIEEYILQEPHQPERGMSSLVAQPLLGLGGSMLGSAIAGLGSRQGSMLDHLKDPVVALLDSVQDTNKPHHHAADAGANLNLGSSVPVDWDEEEENNNRAALGGGGWSDQDDDGIGTDDGMDLRAPLLDARGDGETATTMTMGIGGGWQLAWKYEAESGGVKRMYLHEEAGEGVGGGVHAAALVSQSALYSKQPPDDEEEGGVAVGPAFLAAPLQQLQKDEEEEEEAAAGSSGWRDLLAAPGVRHALVCGVTMQVLQQLSGINGVLYYTPQILDQAGVSVLLSGLGLGADSTSILISGVTTLLMLPTIGVAMRLMDASGRRSLLLWTIPVLVASLATLVAASVVPMPEAAHAAVATGSVMVYLCCFVMGLGPIPNILCAEIFPTRVRGLCIAICSLAFWLADIAVTYSLPVMLSRVGLAGLFGLYAVVCCLALAFVALRVPETKGLPLEVIIDFFNVGARGLPAPAEVEEDHHH
ncbi:hypothetical protein BS78_04G330500 [Paspalum vaginatum]|nr:hypothetical protein BS78_04G330500 [Paspalum vaginatum]